MASNVQSYEHGAPFDAGFLAVSSVHKIHYEQYGNKSGKPVVFLHGGPGGSTSPSNANFFNPAVYRAVIFDQRGAGQSLPLGEIRENTSQLLVSDIEALREHLDIQKWHVFGGSWGSTLSLLYAQTHPESVVSITLRGVFLESKEELEFNTSPKGTWRIHPELYEEFVGHLNEDERNDVWAGYYKRLTSGDKAVEEAAAIMFNKWSTTMSYLIPEAEEAPKAALRNEKAIAAARIECHYHTQNGMIEDRQLVKPENLERIKHIPCAIVNGRYDILCPPIEAWKLHKALPKSKLYIIPDAGHSSLEPGIHAKLTEICNEFATLDI